MTPRISVSLGEIDAIMDWHYQMREFNDKNLKMCPYHRVEENRKWAAQHTKRIRHLSWLKDKYWPK